MEKYLNQFFEQMAQIMQITPQEAAKYCYIAVGVAIAVLLVVFAFQKMKALLWVALGISIMFFAFFGGAQNLGELVAKEIDSEYCTSNPDTFWC